MEEKEAFTTKKNNPPDLEKLRLRTSLPKPDNETAKKAPNMNDRQPYTGKNEGNPNGNIRINHPAGEKSAPRRGCWFLAGMAGCGCLILLFLLALLLLLGYYFAGGFEFNTASFTGEFTKSASPFGRKYLSGKKDAAAKIAVIPVKGILTGSEDRGLSSNTAISGTICNMIREAEKDNSIKAVIVHLDTPGGEVTASDEIYHALTILRKKKPVIACMNSICASGGYYIAAACHPIFAHKLTLTGSIGVIISTCNYKGLFDKLGLKAEVYTSGAMKDMLNGARERTPRETAIIQTLVMNTYDTFTQIVSKSRGIPVENIRNGILGDGRIFDGKQALEHNLVDFLGYFQDAVSATAAKAGLKGEYEVFQFEESFSLEDFFKELFVSVSAAKLLPGAVHNSISLEAGKLYFLPPGF